MAAAAAHHFSIIPVSPGANQVLQTLVAVADQDSLVAMPAALRQRMALCSEHPVEMVDQALSISGISPR